VGKLTRAGFWWNPVGRIEDLIKEWKPRRCKTEGQFEKSLFEFLEERTEGIDLIRQYGQGRARVDIAVGRKVFVELKHNLNSTSKFQRLIGQLEIYKKEKFENIIVVLCGKIDKGFLRELERQAEESKRLIPGSSGQSVSVVRK